MAGNANQPEEVRSFFIPEGMARIRTIKPEFFRHEELYLAEKESGLPLRVAFAGLFTVADREGRFKWKPKQIKFDVLPWDECDFNSVLTALSKYGFIRRYEVGNSTYGVIPTFKDHQAINNKESKSTLPEPPKNEPVFHASFTRADASQGEGKEGKGKEGNIHTVCAALAQIFGKEWIADPTERMPNMANWFKDIEFQAQRLVDTYGVQDAVRQIVAYVSYCKKIDRKLISTTHKVSDTILQCDWVVLNAPDQPPRASPFEDAEANRKLWTEEAWKTTYARQIQTNPEFRKHFQITTQ